MIAFLALDLTSVIFTAPVKGIYHVQFSAPKDTSSSYFDTFLQVNDANFGLADKNVFLTKYYLTK